MEIPSRYFFLFWVAIDVGFLKLGLGAMDKTELLSTVFPSVLFLFKFSSFISAVYSIVYGMEHYLQLNISLVDRYVMVFMVIYCVVFNALVTYLYLILLSLILGHLGNLFMNFFEDNLSFQSNAAIIIALLHLAVLSIITFIADKIIFSIGVFVFIPCLFSPTWLGNLKDRFFHKYLLLITAAYSRQENLFIFNKRKGKKWIEFAVGMVGTILFQNFFRLNSFKEVLVFIYLAASWLANLALVLASNDFGVLNFLLGNVIVGSAVNEYGLGRSTWIAYGTCLLLFGLRLKLESVHLVNRQGEETQVVLW